MIQNSDIGAQFFLISPCLFSLRVLTRKTHTSMQWEVYTKINWNVLFLLYKFTSCIPYNNNVKRKRRPWVSTRKKKSECSDIQSILSIAYESAKDEKCCTPQLHSLCKVENIIDVLRSAHYIYLTLTFCTLSSREVPANSATVFNVSLLISNVACINTLRLGVYYVFLLRSVFLIVLQ